MTALALLLIAPVFAYQAGSPRIAVEETALRAAASVYPIPVYPPASIRANHTGRVVIEVVLAPAGKDSPLTRVQSTKVLEAPDTDMANAVVKALEGARYMPFFDGQQAVEASSRVVWEFRIAAGKPEVIDPHPVAVRPPASDDDLRIVQRARQILGSEASWNRADNRQCPPTAKTLSLYCALEKATQDVTGTFEHRGLVMEDARKVIEENMTKKDYGHRLMGYNNDPTTTFADIQKVLRLTEERIAKRANGR